MFFRKLTARHSLASHRAAKPGRAMTSDFCLKGRAVVLMSEAANASDDDVNERDDAFDKEPISINDCGFAARCEARLRLAGSPPFYERAMPAVRASPQSSRPKAAPGAQPQLFF